MIALGKVDSMLKVEQALQRGEFIGILADRGLEHGGASMTCDFLGRPAEISQRTLAHGVYAEEPGIADGRVRIAAATVTTCTSRS